MPAATGARLARGFLYYLLAVVGLVTLAPFAFHVPQHPSLLWQVPVADFLANILLFVPLGFLYRLTRPVDRDRGALGVLGVGLGFSAIIEATQLFLPTRFSAPADVLANGVGAWLGALALDRVVRHFAETRRTFARLTLALTLELPLMGLLYLLIPLLWLHGLAHGPRPLAAFIALPLGLLGGVVLAALHRYRFGPAGNARPLQVSAAAGAWYAMGVLPGSLAHPGPAIGSTLIVGCWTLLLARAPVFNVERRFEGETLLRIAPLFAAFLGLLLLHPARGPGHSGGWSGTETDAVLRSLEQLAAFTVLGYMVAESRGRREAPFARAGMEVGAVACGVALFMVLVARWQAGSGASPPHTAWATAAAVHGGWIYHLQRAHVKALLSEKQSEGRRWPLAVGPWLEARIDDRSGNPAPPFPPCPIAEG